MPNIKAATRATESINQPPPQSKGIAKMSAKIRGTLMVTLVVLLLLPRRTRVFSADTDENCETLPSEIHLIKEEYDELGRLQRTCNGEVAVNKCEGACNSQVQPSVITPTGFLKECYCCRETFLRERVVTLTHCYDPDGMRLSSLEMATMDIRLKEPADCKCFKCGDFSR